MSFLYDDASNQGLNTANAAVTTEPFTIATWFTLDDSSGNHTLIGVFDSSASSDYYQLIIGAGTLYGQARETVGTSSVTGSSITLNAWTHAAFIGRTSGNIYELFQDGVSQGTNSTDRNPSTPDRTCLGVRGRSSPDSYHSGLLAESAIWNVALTAEDIAALAAGAAPHTIRPDALVFYLPQIRGFLDERVNGWTLGALPTNPPTTNGDHVPGLIYPRRRHIIGVPSSGTSYTPGTAAVTITANAATSQTEQTPGTAAVTITANAATSQTAQTPGTAPLVITANAATSGTSRTPGTAAIIVTANAATSTSGTGYTPGTAPVIITANPATSQTEQTPGTAAVTITANAVQAADTAAEVVALTVVTSPAVDFIMVAAPTAALTVQTSPAAALTVTAT